MKLSEVIQTNSVPENHEVPQADLAYYFDQIFPKTFRRSDRTDLYDNAIEQVSIHVYGQVGIGKSNIPKLLANEVMRRFGPAQISVRVAKAKDTMLLLNSPWELKPVQILVLEDATKVNLSDQAQSELFNIRHKMAQQTGLREGLCIVIIICHKFQGGTEVSLREDYDSLIIMSRPKNPFAQRFFESVTGKSALDLLHDHVKRREQGYILITHECDFLGIARVPKLRYPTTINIIEPKDETMNQQTAKPSPKPIRILKVDGEKHENQEHTANWVSLTQHLVGFLATNPVGQVLVALSTLIIWIESCFAGVLNTGSLGVWAIPLVSIGVIAFHCRRWRNQSNRSHSLPSFFR